MKGIEYKRPDWLPGPTAWDELPIEQKAEMISVGVRNGLHSMDDIRLAYNRSVAGEDIYGEGGVVHPSVIKAEAEKFRRFLANSGKLEHKYDGTSEDTQYINKVGQRYYDYNRPDHPLTQNVDFREVVITPERYKPRYLGDTRSDTTRKGYHEGRVPFNAVDASNTAGLWDLANYNFTGNPDIVTGEPPLPAVGKVVSSRSNVTDNLLKWLGKPLTYKPKLPLSKAPIEKLAYETKEGTSVEKYPGIARMLDLWESKGVDLSRIGVEDLDDVYRLRQASLMMDAPSRYTLANQQGSNYTLTDYQNGKPVGRTDLYIDDSDNLYMSNIRNLTNKYPADDPRRAHDVQRRGLNSAIVVAKSEGKEGVISGNYLQSAPKQYSAIFEHPERIIVSNGGIHTNENMVSPGEYGMFGGWGGPAEASSVEEMWANRDRTAMQLQNAPVWKLTEQSFPVPTKSNAFDPTIIDENGKMHTNWGLMDIFKSLTIPTVIGTAAYKNPSKKK